MERKTVKFTVSVELDPLPGAFHTEESARLWIEAILENILPHYNPQVSSEAVTTNPDVKNAVQALYDDAIAFAGEMFGLTAKIAVDLSNESLTVLNNELGLGIELKTI